MADAATAGHAFTDRACAVPDGARPPDRIPLDSSPPGCTSCGAGPPRYWPHAFDAERAAAARAQIAAGCFDGHVDTCRPSCPDCRYRLCAHCPLCGACPCTWHPDCPRLPFADPSAAAALVSIPDVPVADVPDAAGPVADGRLCWSCGTAADKLHRGGLCPDCSIGAQRCACTTPVIDVT